MDPEKATTVPQVESSNAPAASRRKSRAMAMTALLAAAYLFWSASSESHVLEPSISKHHGHKHGRETFQCTQVAALFPIAKTPELVDMDNLLASQKFENQSITHLAEAVKIPTMSFDDLGPIGKDKRWDVMYDFAFYLKQTFPLVHKNLSLDTINTHGLLYTWKGENPDLKATLLMAHQDVVPVAPSTIDAWTHPPFSGHYDGKYIWGRGASDCKNQLIAIMESVEALIAAGYTPQRTLIMSFGFDEEISGREGAGHLAPYLLEKYGKDSIATIVDEGAGIAKQWGTLMAMPGVAEKGYTDVEITIRMPGGHSSIPPPHTSIGVLSELITLIEANPYPTRLAAENPYLGQLQCGAAHSPDFPKKLRKLVSKHASTCKAKKDELAHEAAEQGLDIQYLMQTSVAVDVIEGGVKVNALPERVSAIVNHRINVGEHPAEAHAKIAHLAKGVAKKYNLTLHAFDGAKEAPLSIMLRASNTTLEPAPVTPTTVVPISAYGILSGTTRALYGEDLVVTPGIMTGNTDTRYYWDLSHNIFRYNPGFAPGEEGLGNIHTINEKQSVEAHINSVKFFSLFIRNMDEAALP